MRQPDPFLPEVIPSPGTEIKEWEGIKKRLELVAPLVTTVHIDVVDGKFAENKTFADPSPFAAFSKELLLEVHLMVEDPISYIDDFAKAGFRRFIGQVEKMESQEAFVAKAQEVGEAGLALDGKTPVSALQVPLIDLDTVLIMTINAGFSGQELLPETLEKVKKLAERQEVPLEIDGGINDKTIQQGRQSGATRFVVTSAIFNAKNPTEALRSLTGVIERS